MKTHDLELVADTDIPVVAVAAHGRLLATSIVLTELLGAMRDALKKTRFSPLGLRTSTSRADEGKKN
jgi:hypothetical protein